MREAGLAWLVGAAVVGVPALLLGVLLLLERLEAWMLRPDERAAAVAALLARVEHPEEVENEVARLLATVDGVTRRPARGRTRRRISGATRAGVPRPADVGAMTAPGRPEDGGGRA